jgi:hypothetical protein
MKRCYPIARGKDASAEIKEVRKIFDFSEYPLPLDKGKIIF